MPSKKRKSLVKRATAAANPSYEQNEERRVVADLPEYVTKMFHQVGFAKWNKEILPVLFLNPFDVPPGGVRDYWMGYYKRHINNGVKMAHLVMWYGVKAEAEMFGVIGPNAAIPYDKAAEKGINVISPKIQKKLEKKLKLTTTEEIFVAGIKELEAARDLAPEHRWLRQHENGGSEEADPPVGEPEEADPRAAEQADKPDEPETEVKTPKLKSAEATGSNKKKKKRKTTPEPEIPDPEEPETPMEEPDEQPDKAKKSNKNGKKRKGITRLRLKKEPEDEPKDDDSPKKKKSKEEHVSEDEHEPKVDDSPKKKKRKKASASEDEKEATLVKDVAEQSKTTHKNDKNQTEIEVDTTLEEDEPEQKPKKKKKNDKKGKSQKEPTDNIEAEPEKEAKTEKESKHTREPKFPRESSTEKESTSKKESNSEKESQPKKEPNSDTESKPEKPSKPKSEPKAEKVTNEPKNEKDSNSQEDHESEKDHKKPKSESDEGDLSLGEDDDQKGDPQREAKLAKRREKHKLNMDRKKEQAAFAKNEEELLPLMAKLQELVLQKKCADDLMKCINKMNDLAPSIVPGFVSEHRIGVLLKEMRKHLDKQSESADEKNKSEKIEVNSKIKALAAMMKKTYFEKLPLVPQDFVANPTKPKIQIVTIKDVQETSTPPQEAATSPQPGLNRKESTQNLEATIEEDEAKRASVDTVKAPPPASQKKKKFSLGAMLGGSNNSSQNAQQQQPAAKKHKTPPQANIVKQEELPSWLWKPLPIEHRPPQEGTRAFALEWIQVALESLPSDLWGGIQKASTLEFDSDIIGEHLERAVHDWSKHSFAESVRMRSRSTANPFHKSPQDFYWAKIHEIVGGLLGRTTKAMPKATDEPQGEVEATKPTTELAKDLFVKGLYKDPMDFVKLPTLTFYNSMKGNIVP